MMDMEQGFGRSPAGAGPGHSAEPEPVPVSAASAASVPNAGHMLREACHALCQSGRFETGQGGCAAVCMSMLGSSRGKPHGCDYAMRVHEDLAASVLRAAAAPESHEANREAADFLRSYFGPVASDDLAGWSDDDARQVCEKLEAAIARATGAS